MLWQCGNQPKSKTEFTSNGTEKRTASHNVSVIGKGISCVDSKSLMVTEGCKERSEITYDTLNKILRAKIVVSKMLITLWILPTEMVGTKLIVLLFPLGDGPKWKENSSNVMWFVFAVTG